MKHIAPKINPPTAKYASFYKVAKYIPHFSTKGVSQ
jgi:hypothetical protein